MTDESPDLGHAPDCPTRFDWTAECIRDWWCNLHYGRAQDAAVEEAVVSTSKRDDLDEAVAGTLEAIRYLAGCAEICADNGIPPVHTVEVLHRVREMLDILKSLDRMLTVEIYDGGIYGDQVHPEIGAYKVSRTPVRTKWDHDDWKSAVRHAIFERLSITGDLIDSATGEVVEKYALLEEAMNVSGSAAPKLTELRRLGLQADEYCHREPGSPSVTFRS